MESGTIVKRTSVLLTPSPFRLCFSWDNDPTSVGIIAHLKKRYNAASKKHRAGETSFEVFREIRELVNFLKKEKLDPQHALEFRDFSLTTGLWKYIHYDLSEGSHRGSFPRGGFGLYGVMIDPALSGNRPVTAGNQIFADCVACSTDGKFPWKTLTPLTKTTVLSRDFLRAKSGRLQGDPAFLVS